MFADMLSLPPDSDQTESTVQLGGSDFENAATIRMCLTLVTKFRLDVDFKRDSQNPTCFEWKADLLNIILFLDKYDFTGGVTLLRSLGSQAFLEGKFAFKIDAFIFGALTGNVALCKATVSAEDGRMWEGDESSEIAGRAFCNLLSYKDMPYSYTCAIPPQFQFALCRAAETETLGTPHFGERFATVAQAVLSAKGRIQCFRTLTSGLKFQPVSTNLPTLMSFD